MPLTLAWHPLCKPRTGTAPECRASSMGRAPPTRDGLPSADAVRLSSRAVSALVFIPRSRRAIPRFYRAILQHGVANHVSAGAGERRFGLALRSPRANPARLNQARRTTSAELQTCNGDHESLLRP